MATGAAAFGSGLGLLKATLVLDQALLLVPGFLLVVWGTVHAFKSGTAPART